MNKESKAFLILLMLVSAGLASAGQLLFKTGISSSGITVFEFLLAGVIAYGLSTVAYLYTLSRSHLSWTYSFVGLSYAFTVALSYFLLAEDVDTLRIFGVVAIVFGTILIGLS